MEALNYIVNDGVPPTTWRTVVASIFYYSTLPIVISFRTATSILLTLFSPLIYLGSFFWRTTIYPFSLLWKLETLYIYLGVAAFIGLLTGAVLYVFSEMLFAILPQDKPSPSLLSKSSDSSRTTSIGSESTLAVTVKLDLDDSVIWYSGPLKKTEHGGIQ